MPDGFRTHAEMSSDQVPTSEEQGKHSRETRSLGVVNSLRQSTGPVSREEIAPTGAPILFGFPGEDLPEKFWIRGVRNEPKRAQFSFHAADHVFALFNLMCARGPALRDISGVTGGDVNAS